VRLGVTSIWGEDLAAYRAIVRSAAEHGIDAIGVGDTPAGWRDMMISLALAALDAPRATITSMVTAPFLRHPLASANAMSSLYELSGGRAVYGLGTGGSNVMAMGRSRATQAEIHAEFDALRDLFAGRGTEWAGAKVAPLRYARPVPIYYSAFGPKALALAGARADGVILFTGDRQIEQLTQNIAAVRSAAVATGRDPKSVDIWVLSYTSIRDDRAQSLDDLGAYLAANALTIAKSPKLLAEASPQERDGILEFCRRYDVTQHVAAGGSNAALVHELGLADYLSGFNTTIGDSATLKAFLRTLESLDVSTFFSPLTGHADPLGTINALAQARDEM